MPRRQKDHGNKEILKWLNALCSFTSLSWSLLFGELFGREGFWTFAYYVLWPLFMVMIIITWLWTILIFYNIFLVTLNPRFKHFPSPLATRSTNLGSFPRNRRKHLNECNNSCVSKFVKSSFLAEDIFIFYLNCCYIWLKSLNK